MASSKSSHPNFVKSNVHAFLLVSFYLKDQLSLLLTDLSPIAARNSAKFAPGKPKNIFRQSASNCLTSLKNCHGGD